MKIKVKNNTPSDMSFICNGMWFTFPADVVAEIEWSLELQKESKASFKAGYLEIVEGKELDENELPEVQAEKGSDNKDVPAKQVGKKAVPKKAAKPKKAVKPKKK